MHKKKSITSIGSAVLDFMFYTDEGVVIPNSHDPLCCDFLAFERSAKITSKDVHFHFGGGAANTAATFSSLGLKTYILAALGDDAVGSECIENFKNLKINSKLIQKPKHCSTGISVIVNSGPKNNHIVFVYRGSAHHLKLTKKVVKKITTNWVHISGLAGSWKKNISYIFENARRRKQLVSWNPGAEQLSAGVKMLRPFLKDTTVFIVNKDEALQLLLSHNKEYESGTLRNCAMDLYSFGSESVIITDGHRGAYLYNGSKGCYQKAIMGKTKNKTGAGDAFAAGYVAGLMLFEDEQKALRVAAHNSHSVVERVGAQRGILTRKQVERIIK